MTKGWSAILLVAAVSVGTPTCERRHAPTEPTPSCSYTIAPPSVAFESAAGNTNVTVTTAAGCAWTAATSASWIAIAAGGSGSGPGSVTYAVTANGGTASRSGTLTIAGQSHTVTQQGRPATACTYDLSPGEATVSKDASAGAFAVSAPADCPWTATSSAAWLVVTSGQGVGSGNVPYAVARNDDIADRSATITVAGKTFTVRQSGDAGRCQYSVSPVDFNPCMPGGTVSASVTTQASCSWTAASNVPWLMVQGGAARTGSGALTMTFPDNYDAPRDGIVMIRWPTPTAGQNVRVAQAGCLYAVSQSAFTFTSSAGTGSFNVLQQSQPNTCGGATQDRCVWSAVSTVPWITVTSSMPRTGDNPAAFAVAANDSTASRIGTITVRDKVVVITQAGR